METFYENLLLWLVVPVGWSETLIGDLSEELNLRMDEEGDTSARAWYRKQAWTTAKHLIWDKVERLVAVGTLIEWTIRLIKR